MNLFLLMKIMKFQLFQINNNININININANINTNINTENNIENDNSNNNIDINNDNQSNDAQEENENNSNNGNDNDNNENINDDANDNNNMVNKIEYDNIYFIDSYHDKKNNYIYIIACCSQYIKSYNYNLNILYHKYQDDEIQNRIYSSALVNESENILKLIASCIDGYIRIWNFHQCNLINRIKICNEGIKGISLWDENNLLIGCDDKSIKVMQINDGNINKILFGHKAKVCCIKTIEHIKYGKCIISKGWGNDFIKIWVNNEIN